MTRVERPPKIQKQPQRHKDAPVKTFKTTTVINITVGRNGKTPNKGLRMVQKYSQWLQTCEMSIKDAKTPTKWQKTTVSVQLWGKSGGFQHFLDICWYLSVVCSLANTSKTNWSGSTPTWVSKTPPSWQQSLAPMQHCNNYWISILKGHHQDTFGKVCRLEKG